MHYAFLRSSIQKNKKSKTETGSLSTRTIKSGREKIFWQKVKTAGFPDRREALF